MKSGEFVGPPTEESLKTEKKKPKGEKKKKKSEKPSKKKVKQEEKMPISRRYNFFEKLVSSHSEKKKEKKSSHNVEVVNYKEKPKMEKEKNKPQLGDISENIREANNELNKTLENVELEALEMLNESIESLNQSMDLIRSIEKGPKLLFLEHAQVVALTALESFQQSINLNKKEVN